MQFTVKQARVLADLTQAEVAEKLGVCEQTYRKIERKPDTATVKQAQAISQLFGLSYDSIFFSIKL